MVADNIIIDRNILALNQLSINEYYYLHLKSIKGTLTLADEDVCGMVNLKELQSKGFLKVTETGVVLRGKSLDLFEDKRNNFIRFIETFPVKSPSGRYLSPAKLEGVAVDKLKKQWKKLFKDQRSVEDHVIHVLEAEIAYRKKKGNMDFMQACEAWLNGANYEKYEYLLEDTKVEEQSNARELM